METAKSFFAGWVGGAGLVLTGQPFDTIKTRMQANPALYRGALDCTRQLIAKDGALALYAGVKPLVLGIGPVFAIYFATYDACERLIRKIRNYHTGPLSIPEMAICGASTGIVGSLFLGPAELIKVRCQVSPQPASQVIKQILRTEGMMGFTKGMWATIVRDVPASAAWFGTFEIIKAHLVQKQGHDITTLQALFAGGCSGITNWMVCLPMDAVKTRQQAAADGVKISWGAAARSIARESGLRGFYRGAVPIFARAFPANAACFAAKEGAMKFFNKLSPPPVKTAAAADAV